MLSKTLYTHYLDLASVFDICKQYADNRKLLFDAAAAPTPWKSRVSCEMHEDGNNSCASLIYTNYDPVDERIISQKAMQLTFCPQPRFDGGELISVFVLYDAELQGEVDDLDQVISEVDEFQKAKRAVPGLTWEEYLKRTGREGGARWQKKKPGRRKNIEDVEAWEAIFIDHEDPEEVHARWTAAVRSNKKRGDLADINRTWQRINKPDYCRKD